MPVFFTNIFINDLNKFNLFKKAFIEIHPFFEEYHIKIRGEYKYLCINFVENIIKDRLFTYQNLCEYDWVNSTCKILEKIESRSIFLFFEDHILVSGTELFSQILQDFDKLKIDCLSYSFYRASKLDCDNLLPLKTKQNNLISIFSLNEKNAELLSKISPKFYVFSLMSIVSMDFIFSILSKQRGKKKLYSKYISYAIMKLPYPLYRKIIFFINIIIDRLNCFFCLYHPSSPFNLEKMISEFDIKGDANFKLGVSVYELFANFDDDNGSYGESAIKRGLYPTLSRVDIAAHPLPSGCIRQMISLEPGEFYRLKYIARTPRIKVVPIIDILVRSGDGALELFEGDEIVYKGFSGRYYSNKVRGIRAISHLDLEIILHDESLPAPPKDD